jgi:CheY-like chemotaxis protein
MSMNTQTRTQILLVEDDPNDEIMTLRTVRKSGISAEIMVVRDGAEALDYLFGLGRFATADSRRMPDCVLLDLHLPKVTGLEVLKRIKSDDLTKRIPVAMLTGSDSEIVVAEILRQGANDCLIKPLSVVALKKLLGVAAA